MAKNINLGIFAVAGGTVDAITAAYTPATLAFYNGLYKQFRASGANTVVAPTLNVDGLGAKAIVKKGGNALVAGDIAGAGHVCEVSYNSTSEKWELLNPASDSDTTFWQAGAGVNSLMDKRSSASSGDNGFAAGFAAQNSAASGQAVGQDANNSGISGQAVGANSGNSGENGQAVGQSATNSGNHGQAVGQSATNSGENGQAVGTATNNTFARSSAMGYGSITTAVDQMNLSQTLRLQAYTGAGTKILQHDNDGIVSGSNVLPSDTTATTQAAGDNDTSVATTQYVDRVNVQSVASGATVTATAANDLVIITAQAEALTLANPTGSWQQGQALAIRIKDNGTSRTIAYGAKFRALGTTLPTATTISKTVYLFVIYNSTDDTFDVTGVSQQA